MSDYVETNEAALVIQLNDHAAGVTTHGPTVGLVAGDLAQATADAAFAAVVVNGQSLYQSKSQEWTEYKRIILYGPLNTPLPIQPAAPAVGAVPLNALASIVARFRQRAERMKAHPAYTLAIGEDCRIVPAIAPAPGIPKPVLAGVAETAFGVRLTFAMQGHDQIEIWRKRGNETVFTLITVDTNNPYFDGSAPLVAGQPEVRQYQARYKDNDLPVGDWSDVITITAHA